MKALFNITNRHNVLGVKAAACVCAFVFAAVLPVSAYAGDKNNLESTAVRKSNAWSTKTLTKTPSNLDLDFTDLNLDLPSVDVSEVITGISPVLKNALFDLPSDTTSPLFKLDLGGGLCIDTTVACAGNDIRAVDLGYEFDFAKDGYKGIDLSLTPRAGVHYDDESSSALVGALLKIGDNLTHDKSRDSNTWYVFAGADAQALTYTPDGQLGGYEGQFNLQDQIIVGDAQAGVAYRMGDADLSLTYLRRQARSENYKFEEDAAALSLTWRR